MSFSLGRLGNQWNDIARVDRDRFNEIKWSYWDRLTCDLIGQTSASELRVLVAVTARTLRFRKFAEAITIQEFCEGLRDDGELVVDDSGSPYFAGCNISKPETVSRAIAGLEEKGLITRWSRQRRGWSNVYMPFSEEWLAARLAALGGAVASNYDVVVPGELVKAFDGELLRVHRVTTNGLMVYPVDDYLQSRGDMMILQLQAGKYPVIRLPVTEVVEMRRARRS